MQNSSAKKCGYWLYKPNIFFLADTFFLADIVNQSILKFNLNL